MIRYTIPLSPVTKKNHGAICRTRDGRPFLRPSAAFLRYQAQAGAYLYPRPIAPLTGPCTVKCLFYMGTRRRVDIGNLISAAHDLLVHYKILEDDNSGVIQSVDGTRVLYDKENPRTEIIITEAEHGSQG